MKKNLPIIIVVILLTLVALHALSTTSSTPTEEPVVADITIATSFYPLAFAVEKITGGYANVINIGEGRDPHDVQLSAQDVLAMQQADLVVIQGADLEPWGDDTAEQLEAEGVPVHNATADLTLMEGGHNDEHEKDGHEDEAHEGEDEHEDEEEGHEDEDHEGEEVHEGEEEHGHGEFDPHTWLDPVMFSETIEHLTEAIVAIDSENAETYEANAAALQAELASIDSSYSERLANCSIEEVITSHDAFGYIGERYGFEIHTITGLSTQDLPSTQTLAELREEAEEGVGAILLEENSVAAYGETLAAETGLRTLPINPIAYIVPEGEDYTSIMRTNLDTFADALQCS